MSRLDALRALVTDFGDEHRCCPIQPILDEIDRLKPVGLPNRPPVVIAADPGAQVAFGPSDGGWETPCAPSPDGRHCRHWYDDPQATCCYEAKEPSASTEPSQDQVDYVNRLMEASSIPESWDDDASADDILERYLLELERRVLALGGSLERWIDDEECPPNCERPGPHGAHAAPAEVMPSVYGIRGHRVMTDGQAAEAQRAYEAAPLAGLALVHEAIGCPPSCACGGRGIDPETEHPTRTKEA